MKKYQVLTSASSPEPKGITNKGRYYNGQSTRICYLFLYFATLLLKAHAIEYGKNFERVNYWDRLYYFTTEEDDFSPSMGHSDHTSRPIRRKFEGRLATVAPFLFRYSISQRSK
mmetsp:Transcript_28108/g.39739  ORF Transcript_28108/g.39739 Transcript_28108/m.39739 type:complete len:114 (+) Transcript_28108:1230-1571(+)